VSAPTSAAVPAGDATGPPGHPAAVGAEAAEDPLTETAAESYISGICFKTGPPGRLGVELEWLVHDAHDTARQVTPQRVGAALAGLGTLPAAGLITTEPGGQLELSSQPAASILDCVTATRRDLARLRGAMADAGLRLTGHGLDPFRAPCRVLDWPRYAAMEEFFDRTGPWGRIMMCSTASVQVCVDAGEDGGHEQGFAWRWRLVHALGPVLVAAFANSPLSGGRPSGWRSTRQAVWSRLDPSRTTAPAGGDPRQAWTAYVLDAAVLCVQRPSPHGWYAPDGMSFRDWLRGAGERPATLADLTYHLTTLFPPVRPRGHLELRMIDAQPGDGWIVPLAVVSALLEDAKAADEAMAALAPLYPARRGADPRWELAGGLGDRLRPGEDPWLRAARHGPTDPALGTASRACFEAADAALGRLGAPASVRTVVGDFTERYVLRDRAPADDQLDAAAGVRNHLVEETVRC
jgi:glutamate--cysteine ligase